MHAKQIDLYHFVYTELITALVQQKLICTQKTNTSKRTKV